MATCRRSAVTWPVHVSNKPTSSNAYARKDRRPAPNSSSDSARTAVDSVDSAQLDRVRELAAQVQQTDAAQAHRLGELRERVASGDYTADPEELANILLPVLRGERSEG